MKIPGPNPQLHQLCFRFRVSSSCVPSLPKTAWPPPDTTVYSQPSPILVPIRNYPVPQPIPSTTPILTYQLTLQGPPPNKTH
jgi:hypothetical protein